MMRRLAFLVPVAMLVSCGVDDELGTSNSGASTGANDNGTGLSVVTSEPVIACSGDGSGAGVTVGYTVTSTAAANGAVVTAIVDGGEETQVGSIASGADGWTFDGRTKTATGSATFTLANGDHTIVICVTQSGAGGRLPKRACSEAVAVTVACEAPPHCNQGIGNGAEGCDPGNSNNGHHGSNDEGGRTPPGRR
jgi:hypothetical protein